MAFIVGILVGLVVVAVGSEIQYRWQDRRARQWVGRTLRD